jgi:hypothetical protein
MTGRKGGNSPGLVHFDEGAGKFEKIVDKS